MAIRFFSEEIKFKLPHPRKTANWIKGVIKKEKGDSGELSFIFCSDSYLHAINKEYLNHDTLTDIITFGNNSNDDSVVSGDIYISVDRVRQNAETFNAPFDNELHRVLIHGVLHLLGYNDKNPAEIALMRKKEEAYLSLRK